MAPNPAASTVQPATTLRKPARFIMNSLIPLITKISFLLVANCGFFHLHIAPADITIFCSMAATGNRFP
jgi:hypothetical protein